MVIALLVVLFVAITVLGEAFDEPDAKHSDTDKDVYRQDEL